MIVDETEVTLDRPVGVLFLDSEKGVVFIDWCVGADGLTRQVVRDLLQKIRAGERSPARGACAHGEEIRSG